MPKDQWMSGKKQRQPGKELNNLQSRLSEVRLLITTKLSRPLLKYKLKLHIIGHLIKLTIAFVTNYLFLFH